MLHLKGGKLKFYKAIFCTRKTLFSYCRYEDAVDEYRSVMKSLQQSDKTEDDMVDVEDIRVGILGKLGGDTSRLPGDAISKVNIANEVCDDLL